MPTDGPSRELIIQAATDLLDDGGESALTLRFYRSPAHRLRSDLPPRRGQERRHRPRALVRSSTQTREALRHLALGLFDAIDAHPWAGAELSRQPWRPALLEFYENIDRLLDALAVTERARFDTAGTLVNYILGIAVQNAANARLRTGSDTERERPSWARGLSNNRTASGVSELSGLGLPPLMFPPFHGHGG